MQGGFDGRDGYPVDGDRVVARRLRPGRPRSVASACCPAGVSGNPASPHWNDQSPLWIAGEHHPLPFTRPAVEAAAVATLRLLPG